MIAAIFIIALIILAIFMLRKQEAGKPKPGGSGKEKRNPDHDYEQDQ